VMLADKDAQAPCLSEAMARNDLFR
jgi:hypothetical protein